MRHFCPAHANAGTLTHLVRLRCCNQKGVSSFDLLLLLVRASRLLPTLPLVSALTFSSILNYEATKQNWSITAATEAASEQGS